MQYRNLLHFVERKIGAKRAAVWYYDIIFRFAARIGIKCFNYGYAAIDADASFATPDAEPFQLKLYRQTALAAGEESSRADAYWKSPAVSAADLPILSNHFDLAWP